VQCSRRSFLTACGAATAGFAANSSWKMRLSTSTVQFRTLPVEKAVARIAQLGYEAIDFWPSNFKCPHLDEIATRLGADGLKALLKEHGVKLCAFTMYENPYEKYAELLGRAGGGLVIRQSKYGKIESASLKSEIAALIEQLKPWLELAEKNNSYIAVENHGGALLNSVDSFREFLEQARHTRLGVALAPYHLQAEGTSVEKVIEILGPKMLFFYAWQNAPGTQQLPGLGPTDFTPWLRVLARTGYQGWVNPFMHGEPDVEEMTAGLARSKAYLQECLKRI
jgi:sugar phosphate isomerase/epimerase